MEVQKLILSYLNHELSNTSHVQKFLEGVTLQFSDMLTRLACRQSTGELPNDMSPDMKSLLVVAHAVAHKHIKRVAFHKV